jgi:AraC-like DNA-binding protein
MAFPVRNSAALRGAVGVRSVYREFAPSADLVGVVACTWAGCAGWARALRLLPDGCVDLVWDGTSLAIIGARPGITRYPLADNTRSVGLRLRAGAVGGIVSSPAFRLPARRLPLDAVWDEGCRSLATALRRCTSASAQRETLERAVARRLDGDHHPDRTVLTAVLALEAGANVAAAACEASVSPRELRRRFRNHLGYGPKTFGRVARFHGFVSHLCAPSGAPRSLAELAAQFGYADQAHLTRECRLLSASTPGRLAAFCMA